MSGLDIWSTAQGEWQSQATDEIIWLDRVLLSDGRDRTLHRPPRCPGLRHVHHRWELFSRDTSHSVYVAPFIPADNPDHHAVEAAARHVLAPARLGFETQPVQLDAGSWAISVGKWLLFVCVEVPSEGRRDLITPHDELPVTYDLDRAAVPVSTGTQPAPDAIERVARYFGHNPEARLAMAYYYQDFIRGELVPQLVPISRVAIALDLTSGSAVSEYKKELQRRIWNEQGHQRELGSFLLVNGLIGQSDLAQALRVAAENDASGRTRLTQARLRYKAK